jgi:hypothetical protein
VRSCGDLSGRVFSLYIELSTLKKAKNTLNFIINIYNFSFDELVRELIEKTVILKFKF